MIQSNGVQPESKTPLQPEALQASIGFEQDLLHGLIGLLGAVQHAAGQGVRKRRVALHEHSQGLVPAAQGLLEGRPVLRPTACNQGPGMPTANTRLNGKHARPLPSSVEV